MRQEWTGTAIKPVAIPGIQTLIHFVIITLILTALSLSAFLPRVPFSRGFVTCELALLNLLAFPAQRPRPGFSIQLWVGVHFLIIRVSSRPLFQDSQLFFCLDFTQQTDRQTAVFLTMVPAYQCSVLEFSGLEGTNLIDFFPPSQSPDSKRSFWSVSVLTSSQLALDMSMSSPVWSGWCFCVSHWWDSAHNSLCVVSPGTHLRYWNWKNKKWYFK